LRELGLPPRVPRAVPRLTSRVLINSWRALSGATLGTTADFKGTILALTTITLATGAKLDGRALAQNGSVTLQDNTVTLPLGNTLLIQLPPPPDRRD
jgi:hypothetical protein